MIKTKNLGLNYNTFYKKPGLKGTINDFFNRKKIIVPALKEINLQIADGAFIGLIGPNGAGKTTLTKILTGILEPTTGTVRVDNFVPHEKSHVFLKQIGVMFGQKSQLSWDLPAIDTLNMLSYIYELDSKEYKKRLSELCTLLDAQMIIRTPVRKLSLGQRVKCELMCALIHSPKYLFLDEPTLGLDLVTKNRIYAFLKKENKEKNTTIILTSHNVQDIKAMAKQIIILANGSIIYQGNINKLPLNINKSDSFTLKYYVNGKKTIQEKTLNSSDLKQELKKLPAEDILQINRVGISLEELIMEIYNEHQ